MEKFKFVNCYVKDGNYFLVFTTKDGKTYSANLGLISYAIEHPKKVGEKKND